MSSPDVPIVWWSEVQCEKPSREDETRAMIVDPNPSSTQPLRQQSSMCANPHRAARPDQPNESEHAPPVARRSTYRATKLREAHRTGSASCLLSERHER
jgi:hypothetical protein